MFVELLKSILLSASACLALGFPFHVIAATNSQQPLSDIELQAIKLEATAHWTAMHVAHPPTTLPPWVSLNPDKLQRMIASGQLQDVGYLQGQGILIDQAMAWNLVHFQNLSDIKRFFQLTRGTEYFHEPPATARSDDGPSEGYISEESASAEGGAISALYNCMPDATWDIESIDPVLWMMQRSDSADQAGAQNFSHCVRNQRTTRTWMSSEPNSKRGAQSALIIADRLSRQLLAHGCHATGPDQCLGLLNALVSLDKRHPALVTIVKKLDVEVGASTPTPLQMPKQPEQTDFHNAAQMDQYHPMQDALWQQEIVLSVELNLMHQQPDAWSTSQRERVIDGAIGLMINQRKLDWMFSTYGGHIAYDYPLSHPWQLLSSDGKTSDELTERLAKLGDAAAAEKGCAFAKLRGDGQPAEYWLGYALRKLRDEHQDCDALPLAWIATRYVAASQTHQPAMLASIKDLEALDSNRATSPIGKSIEQAIAQRCPETGFGADDWGICKRNAAQVAATRAQQAAEELAAKQVQQAIDVDPCQNGTVDDLLTEFGYIDDKGVGIGPNTITQCDALPRSDHVAVIAVYRKQSAPGAKDEQDADGDYDLHLMLASKDGTLLAQGHFKNAATSDAVSLDKIDINPKRYVLATGVSAFGVTTVNNAHCHQCNYSESVLSLFVRDGHRLRLVLKGFPIGSTQQVSDVPDPTTHCEGAYDTITNSIETATSAHHGFADLLITQDSSHNPGYLPDSGDACTQTPGARASESPPASTPERWIYDGKVYRQPKQTTH